jgi:hypothetical protein
MKSKKAAQTEKLLQKIFGKPQAEVKIPVRALLHPNNYSHYRIKPLVFTWGWCSICKCPFVRCPVCGHNTCSPTIGQLENKKFCEYCELAFQYHAACPQLPTEKQIKRAKCRLVLHTGLKLEQNERKK